MAMPPRIILFSAIGIILYLGLSLYHGHQLRQYPLLEREGGKALSARAEEKTWVQVSTTKQVAAGPVQPAGHGQPAAAIKEEAEAGDQRQSSSAREQQQAVAPVKESDDPQVLLPALQAELLQARTLLQNREEDLRRTRLQLEKAREEQQQAVAGARALRDNLIPTRKEQESRLAEIDRLQTELKESRARAAIAEEELERARLKAEAMFRYGQEQSRLLAPSRQEVEVLKTRLQETSGKLLQAEQQITELTIREQQLRKELNALPGAPAGAKAPAAQAAQGNEPTAAGARAD
jgi:chromosome segregation ATPase